jgi:branched-chain amino acid transport system permease protein
VLAAVVIGGIGTLVGPLIGGFIVQFAAEGFREFGLQHMLFFAAMVILIVRFFRQGLWGLLRAAWDRLSAAGVARPGRVREAGE